MNEGSRVVRGQARLAAFQQAGRFAVRRDVRACHVCAGRGDAA